ncbi:true [Symbiodinium sp. KB8]|nr:true [Symbiodinium sp. KB8]
MPAANGSKPRKQDETQQSFFESLYAALDADANEIADGLFLGAAKAASDKAAMKKRKISHVLIAHPTMPEKHPQHFKYGRAPLVDLPAFNLLEQIPDAISFLREARSKGGKVFCYCAKGISRSSSLVIILPPCPELALQEFLHCTAMAAGRHLDCEESSDSSETGTFTHEQMQGPPMASDLWCTALITAGFALCDLTRRTLPFVGKPGTSLAGHARLKSFARTACKETPLLDEESNDLFLLLRGMTTVSFCTGTPPIPWLRERLAAVLAANPWLAGNLSRTSSEDRVCLRYEEDTREEAGHELLQRIGPDILDIHPDMPYDILTKKVSGSCAEVPSGVECLRNSSHPLLKVTICSSSSDQFALLVSLSHIIADGYTYYRIFHMLTRKLTPVLSLRPQRKLAFHQERLCALGRPEYEFIFSPAYVLNSLTSKFLWGRPKCRAYVINMEKVQAAKRTLPAVPLSTNDIVTSSVARLFGARACSMAVNFRGRLANLSEEDAGNYQGLLWFGPDDISAPSLVRAALEQGSQQGVYRRCGSDPVGQLPGFWEMLCSRLAVITSWVFEDEPMLEGCTMGLHLPHFDLDEVNSDMAVIFRPRPGQQAVMLFTKDLNVDVLAAAPDSVLGEPVVFSASQGKKLTALLMLERGISFEEAWTFCEKRRPIVYPNVGFQQQLRHLEKVMTEKVDFKAPWQKQVKQLREALPKGDLEGPKSPLPIRDAIGSCMGAALTDLEALVDKVLSQPQLLQKRELWKRQGF